MGWGPNCRAPHCHITAICADEEPPPPKCVERPLGCVAGEARSFGDVGDNSDTQFRDDLPRPALLQTENAKEPCPAICVLGDKRELVALEHRLDRLDVRLTNTAEKEVNLAARRIGGDVLQEKLGDDLVGTREIEKADVRKVDYGQRAITDAIELVFDLGANGGSGGACHQIRIQLAHTLAEHRADVDVIDQATLSGIVICTCEPEKNGRFFRSGSSSSQSPLGRTAMRAVPLRIESLPSQFPTKRLTPASP